MTTHKQQQLQTILRLPSPDLLPDDGAIDLYEDRRDPAYNAHTIYVRLRGTQQSYDALMQAVGMTPVADSDLRMLLPGKWKTPEVIKLDWWTPNINTPPNAAGSPFGKKNANGEQVGWILAQYNEGYIFLRVYLGS